MYCRVEAVRRLAEAEKELAKARNERHAAAEEVSDWIAWGVGSGCVTGGKEEGALVRSLIPTILTLFFSPRPPTNHTHTHTTLKAQSLSAALAEAHATSKGKEATWEEERVRTQKALEQAAAEIKRLRERERAAVASGGKRAEEAMAAWEAEREEVRACVYFGGWWLVAGGCGRVGGAVLLIIVHPDLHVCINV